jgi:hypothetical protein
MSSQTQESSSDPDTRAISTSAAWFSLAAAFVAIGSLAASHGLSPEFDPSWRVVSEYALGKYWWVLSLMFIAWGASSLALAVAIRSQLKTPGGKVGLALLIIAGVGQGMAAFFDLRQTVMHNVAAGLGIPCLPIAATLISTRLSRSPAWASSKAALRWTAAATWVSLALMVLAMASLSPKFPLKVPIGWPNRLLVVVYCVWAVTVAWQALGLRRSTPLEGSSQSVFTIRPEEASP